MKKGIVLKPVYIVDESVGRIIDSLYEKYTKVITQFKWIKGKGTGATDEKLYFSETTNDQTSVREAIRIGS